MAEPPRRLPRIGLLHWHLASKVKNGYCRELYRFLDERRTAGELEFEVLGCELGRNPESDPGPSLEAVRNARLDALITNGIWNEPYLGDLHALGLPMVSVDFQPRGSAIDAVTFSNERAGEQIGRIFAETGHRDVMFVSVFRNDRGMALGATKHIEDDTSLERRSGVQQALVTTSVEMWPTLPLLVRDDATNYHLQLVAKLPKMFQSLGQVPQAITGHDNTVLHSVLEALTRMNLKVPGDVSLIGFHGVDRSKDEVPPDRRVNCMLFCWQDMAEQAWKLLQGRLSGKVPPETAQRLVSLPGQYTDFGTVRDRHKPSA